MDSSVISAVDLYLGSSCQCCVATYSHSLVSSLSLTWPRNCLLLCIWRSIAPGFLLLYLWSERALWTFLHSLKLPWDKIRMVCGKASHMKSYGALHCHTLIAANVIRELEISVTFLALTFPKHWPYWEMASTIPNETHSEEWHQPFRRGKFAVELHPGIQTSNKEVTVKPKFAIYDVKNKVSFTLYKYQPSGREINFFFSDSHLAPKFFKVVAKWKKVGRHFQRQTKPSFKPSAF